MDGVNGIIGLGHGHQSLRSFLRLLTSLNISVVVDVRTFTDLPSRPHFAPASLASALICHDIRYRRIEVLSGSREHECLDVRHFFSGRCLDGYERHTQSKPFQTGLAAVMRESEAGRVAIMCAERHCRCHRLLLEQTLKDRGISVITVQGLEPLHAEAA